MVSVHYSSSAPSKASIEGSHPSVSTSVLSGSSQMAFTTWSPAFSLFVYGLSLLADWSYFRRKNILYLPNVPYTKE